MKNYLLYVFFFFSASVSAQGYQWAFTDSTYDASSGISLSEDRFNNLYVVQSYASQTLGYGINVIKYNPNRIKLWQKDLQCKKFISFSVASDNAGNVYFGGTYRDTVFFNNTIYKPSCPSCPDMLLIKFDSLGNLKWIKNSTNDSYGFAFVDKVTTDTSNNIYFCGSLSSKVKFDGDSVITPGYKWYYVAKYSSEGQKQWMKFIKGNVTSVKRCFQTDKQGNSYIASCFFSVAQFDSLSVKIHGTYPDEDIFLAKINSNGQWQWATSIYCPEEQEEVFGLALDKKGLPYLTGFVSGPVTHFGNLVKTKGVGDNYFVAKYDTTGSIIWATVGGTSNSAGVDIAIDGNDISYVRLSNSFFSLFSQTGIYLGSQFVPAYNYSMLRSNDDCVYIAGSLTETTNFDSIILPMGKTTQMYITKNCTPLTVGIVETSQIVDLIIIYPNPSSGIFTLKGEITQTKITVHDVLGNCVWNKEYRNETDMKIDLSDQSKGIYFVEISAGGKRAVRKIVIE